jgi:hypothetical protein
MALDLKIDPTLMRSTQTVEYVREEKRRNGEVLVIRATMPVGLGYNDGTAIFYNNLGWQSAAEYDARKHKEEVEKAQAEAKLKEAADKADAALNEARLQISEPVEVAKKVKK